MCICSDDFSKITPGAGGLEKLKYMLLLIHQILLDFFKSPSKYMYVGIFLFVSFFKLELKVTKTYAV